MSEGEEQKSVARALDILFESGKNILQFYQYRNQLAYLNGDAAEILVKMRAIAEKEIANTEALAALSEADGRLGYHAEAAAYKFFPEKLFWRIGELKKMLETEFPAVEKRIKAGRHPLPFCLGLSEESHRYETNAGWESFMHKDGAKDENTKIRICENKDSYTVEICLSKDDSLELRPEFQMFHPYAGMGISLENGLVFDITDSSGIYPGYKADEQAKWHAESQKTADGILHTITLHKKDFFEDGDVPFRLAVTRHGAEPTYWEKPDRTAERLRHGIISPDSYVFVIPKSFQSLR